MEKSTVKQNGGCQCGAHRFEACGTPEFVCKCHCKSCRKATGAAFSTWVGFKNEQASWVTKEPTFHASSKGVQRGFCAQCGTPLTYAGEKWPGEIHFLIGTFDNSGQFTPTGKVFADEALSWVATRKL